MPVNNGGGSSDATTLDGKTWAAPGAIGSTTPSTGAFTSASANLLALAAGAVGAPSLTWGGDGTSGFYRIGANDYGFSISGVKLAEFSAGNFTVSYNGIILARFYRDPADAADTADQAPFAHFCDVHYQSTNLATKAKAPNFYV